MIERLLIPPSSCLYIREPFLGLLSFAFGDAGIEDAAKNGHLTRITYVDYDLLLVFGFVGIYKVIVHGD
jgi:TRL-like protein family